MRTIRMLCVDAAAAAEFTEHLKQKGIDVDKVEGRVVVVPSNRPGFGWDLAQLAVDQDCAHEHDALTAAREFVMTFPGVK